MLYFAAWGVTSIICTDLRKNNAQPCHCRANTKHGICIEINQLDNLQVTVDTTEIDFGVIGFIETSSRALTVANTGQVPVQFEFIKKLNDKSICKSWLSVEPSSGFIMPGDKVGPSQTQFNWLPILLRITKELDLSECSSCHSLELTNCDGLSVKVRVFIFNIYFLCEVRCEMHLLWSMA